MGRSEYNAVRRDASPLECSVDFHHGLYRPACRLVLEPGAKEVQVLTLTRHHALRRSVPLGKGAKSRGETVLPTKAVRALCATPLREPLTIEAEGITIVTTMGTRSQTFEAHWRRTEPARASTRRATGHGA